MMKVAVTTKQTKTAVTNRLIKIIKIKLDPFPTIVIIHRHLEGYIPEQVVQLVKMEILLQPTKYLATKVVQNLLIRMEEVKAKEAM